MDSPPQTQPPEYLLQSSTPDWKFWDLVDTCPPGGPKGTDAELVFLEGLSASALASFIKWFFLLGSGKAGVCRVDEEFLLGGGFHMTGKVFIIIAKAWDSLIYERTQQAFNPPPISNIQACNRHTYCTTHWVKGWWEEVTKWLLDLSSPVAVGGEMGCVQSATFLGISPLCKDALIQLVVTQNFFGRGEKILKAAEEGICKLYDMV
ncbi:hypothetical protein P691DRAFT_781494 [Macrolepiota fuliginosa MF-IS2]|uniref:Uncharacterized protein n=1 Tax=Macrolepiota fuliginosa MF-IS2 TaxID=1400762 RepID=A0A9P5WYN8_9AGAR|nr:hypothetical protein P691DRAFT_781494 [Macrolepiota fuliginosa MF-IS2]